MKLSLQWLKELIGNTKISDEEIIDSIEKLGYEIESVYKQNFDVLSKIKVVKVLSVKKHPNADKLVLCDITDGQTQQEVVCGAPNVYKGMITAYVSVGGILADGTKVKQRKIRGVVSNGMLCSAKELGLYDDHSGILELDNNFVIGDTLEKYFSDTIIEIATPANRYDCLGHFGIAKELAVKLGVEFKNMFVDLTHYVNLAKTLPMFDVKILSYQWCKRYVAIQINNVNNKISLPFYIKYRLNCLGLRSINPLVDISNYIMCLVGHSVHIFDFNKLVGGKIFVKTAEKGEAVTALDSKTYSLDNSVIVISDEEKPVAIAGIIGLENSCVDENTNSILIESAVFNRSMIRLARKKLGINTEASYRFERGSGWNLAEYAAFKTCQMVLEHCGGEIVKFSDEKDVEYYNNLTSFQQNVVKVDLQNISSILGFDLETDKFIDLFTRLGYQMKQVEQNSGSRRFFLLPPFERQDIKFQADIVEEIARFVGYEKIPLKLPNNINSFYKQKSVDKLQKQIVQCLISAGLNQTINYSLCSYQENKVVLNSEQESISILNPVSNDYSQLRLSLFNSLIKNLITNYGHQIENIALFELGKVFYKQNGQIKEELQLGIITHGEHQYLSWAHKILQYDFYHICGIVETLFNTLGIKYVKDIKIANEKFSRPMLDKSLFKNLVYYLTADNRETISFVGEVDKEKLKLKLPNNVFYAEVYFELLLSQIKEEKVFILIPKYPFVVRDLCLKIPEEMSFSELEKIISHFVSSKKLVCEMSLIDFYKKDNEKFLTFKLKLQDLSKTLTDEEVNNFTEKLLQELNKYNIYLREK